MSIRVRLKLNRRGIGEVLRSVGVQHLLEGKAERVAEAVRARGIKVEGEPGEIDLPVTTNVTGRGVRARAYVNLDHPSGLAVEAEHRILGSSIDAARDSGA